MTKLNSSYADRRYAREAKLALKRQIVFGLVLGGLGCVVGYLKTYIDEYASASIWSPVMVTGIILVLVSLIAPWLITPLEGFGRLAFGKLGKTILAALLSVIYFVVIFPVGILMKAFQSAGAGFAHSWSEASSDVFPEWTKKQSHYTTTENKKTSMILQPAKIIRFFIQNGSWFMLPVLVILIALGLIMFFAQTSAFAPFIYTLF